VKAEPTLLVMRHGPAADHAVTGLDDDRILTPSGRLRVERMAEALVARGAIPSALLTSPLARAAETATLVLRVLRKHGHEVPLHIAKGLAPGRLSPEVAEAITDAHPGLPCIVGHEPCLSTFVADVAHATLPLGFEKAMIVALSGKLPRMHLAWVLDPAEHGG
jgi:phosphohistidine phosphatase SixA